MFYDIYSRLCAQKGVSESKVAEIIGLNRASIYKWKNGSKPGGATVKKLADYFDVPIDTLLIDEEDKPFYANYKRLCFSVGKSPSAVAEELGYQKAAVTRWKQGGKPNEETSKKLAEYFHITVDELLGNEKKEKPDVNDDNGPGGLTEKEKLDELVSRAKSGKSNNYAILMGYGGDARRISITEEEAIYLGSILEIARKKKRDMEK